MFVAPTSSFNQWLHLWRLPCIDEWQRSIINCWSCFWCKMVSWSSSSFASLVKLCIYRSLANWLNLFFGEQSRTSSGRWIFSLISHYTACHFTSIRSRVRICFEKNSSFSWRVHGKRGGRCVLAVIYYELFSEKLQLSITSVWSVPWKDRPMGTRFP